MQPFPYQSEAVSEIFDKLQTKDRVLFQANTGAGKTVIMAFICKRWIEEGRGKVIITVHRKELVDQTISTLNSIGLSAQPYTANSKDKHHFVDVYVAMIETLNIRLNKNKFDTDGITLVISDECHILVHSKVYQRFEGSKIIGFTATPVVLKKTTFYKCKYCKSEAPEPGECCGEEAAEWKKPFTMSEVYDDIVIGADIKHLIEFGQLVPEVSFNRAYADLSALEVDSKGEYTTKSMDAAYGTEDAAFNVLLNYRELCSGKRTMVFNPSTHTNLLIYEKFKEAGINVRMFDSVNSVQSGCRKEVVEWFKNTPDAVLLNCGVFTTGFDCKEVEAIIINRATMSMSLFLQITGRGGRSSNKIFKDHFILIDGGDNISRFGEWSADRDWRKIFFEGLGKAKAKKLDAIDINDCPNCGALFPKSEPECPECGETIPPPPPRQPREHKESDEIMKPIREIPPPNGEKIYQYTISQGENINFAFKVLFSRIVDMFIYYRVTLDQYEKSKQSGELNRKVGRMLRPVYFHLMKKKDIHTGSRRTLNYMMEKAKLHIEKYYNRG